MRTRNLARKLNKWANTLADCQLCIRGWVIGDLVAQIIGASKAFARQNVKNNDA